jgi:hypothetical protein
MSINTQLQGYGIKCRIGERVRMDGKHCPKKSAVYVTVIHVIPKIPKFQNSWISRFQIAVPTAAVGVDHE